MANFAKNCNFPAESSITNHPKRPYFKNYFQEANFFSISLFPIIILRKASREIIF